LRPIFCGRTSGGLFGKRANLIVCSIIQSISRLEKPTQTIELHAIVVSCHFEVFIDKKLFCLFGTVRIFNSCALILNKRREIYNNCTYLMAEVINVVALVKVKPEHIKDAEPLVRELAEASRKEPGVTRYEIYRVKEKEGVYVFLEQYKSEADFAAHKQTEHFLNAIKATSPFMIEPPTIVSLEKEQI